MATCAVLSASCAPSIDCASEAEDGDFRRQQAELLRERENIRVRASGTWWWFGLRCCSCAALGGERDLLMLPPAEFNSPVAFGSPRRPSAQSSAAARAGGGGLSDSDEDGCLMHFDARRRETDSPIFIFNERDAQ
jgi:hypothetical protein